MGSVEATEDTELVDQGAVGGVGMAEVGELGGP